MGGGDHTNQTFIASPPSTSTTHVNLGFIMAQRNGLEAIGAVVGRHFGADGYFERGSLYRVKYTDGDHEDLDQGE